MKNKYSLIIFSCIFQVYCSTHAFAQDLSINWGPDISKEEIKARNLNTAIYEDKSSRVELEIKGTFSFTYTIVKTNKKYETEKETYDLSKYLKTQKAEYVDAHFINKQLVIFFFTLDRAEKKIKLFAQGFNENIQPENEPVYITSNPFTGIETRFCRFMLKKYGDKIMAYYQEFYDLKPYKPNAIRFALINPDLKLDWEVLFPIEKGEIFKGVKFETLTENEQNLISLIKVGKRDSVSYKLCKYDKISNQPVIQQVNYGESKYITESQISINPKQNTIYVTQLYSNLREKNWGMEGLLSIEYSLETLKESRSQRIPFSNELLQKIMPLKQVEKNRKPNVEIIDIATNNDGTLTILIEEQNVSSLSSGNMPSQNSTIYSFGAIILLKIDLTVGLVWDNVVSKHQSSSGDLFMRFASVGSIFENNHTYLLFNTDIDNLNNNHEYKLRDIRNPTSLAFIIVNDEGKVVKEGIVKTPDYPTIIDSLYKSKKDGKYYITARKYSDTWGIPEQENEGEILLK